MNVLMCHRGMILGARKLALWLQAEVTNKLQSAPPDLMSAYIPGPEDQIVTTALWQ